MLVDLADSFRRANGDAQDTSQIERVSHALLQNQIYGSPPGSWTTRIVQPS
jgi:hypothetical protein